MRHLLLGVLGTLASAAMAADQAPTTTSSTTEWNSSSEPMAGTNVGKEAMPDSADSAYARQGRASALTFNRAEGGHGDLQTSGSSSGMQPDSAWGNSGKPAAPNDEDRGNGRAGALEFNRLEREFEDSSSHEHDSHDHHGMYHHDH